MQLKYKVSCSRQRPGQAGEVHVTAEPRVGLEQAHDDGHGGLVGAGGVAGGRGGARGLAAGLPRPRQDLLGQAARLPGGVGRQVAAGGGGAVSPAQ